MDEICRFPCDSGIQILRRNRAFLEVQWEWTVDYQNSEFVLVSILIGFALSSSYGTWEGGSGRGGRASTAWHGEDFLRWLACFTSKLAAWVVLGSVAMFWGIFQLPLLRVSHRPPRST